MRPHISLIFDKLFTEQEQAQIRSRNRSEPLLTARKAFILFAYMKDYSIYEIYRCVERSVRQTLYLLAKAEDLYSVNDAEMHKLIEKYESTLAEPDRICTETD